MTTMRSIPASRIHELRILAERGLTASAIALEMGTSAHLVLSAARQHGIVVRKMTPTERAVAAQARSAQSLGARHVRVPAWVPKALRSEYRDQMVSMGAQWAERHVRRMMEDGNDPPE